MKLFATLVIAAVLSAVCMSGKLIYLIYYLIVDLKNWRNKQIEIECSRTKKVQCTENVVVLDIYVFFFGKIVVLWVLHFHYSAPETIKSSNAAKLVAPSTTGKQTGRSEAESDGSACGPAHGKCPNNLCCSIDDECGSSISHCNVSESHERQSV